MGLIITNAPGSVTGHLSPFTIEMTVPLPPLTGAGTSDVLEIGRYTDMSIILPGNDYVDGTIAFEGCDTPDGTFVPIRCAASTGLSAVPQLAFNPQSSTSPALFLLSGSGFGQAGAVDTVSFRGFTVPYIRFDVSGASTLLIATTIIVTLKMY